MDLLRSRRFGTFWFASLLSNIGTWAQQVAQPWLLLSLRASSVLIGLDAFAMSAPVWLLTLVGGVLADRFRSRAEIDSVQSFPHSGAASTASRPDREPVYARDEWRHLAWGLLTGLSVRLLGVRRALFVNGVLMVAAIIVVSRGWLRSRLPTH